jgi:hypothetical protein
MKTPIALVLGLAAASVVDSASGQGIVIDQGRFDVTVDGQRVGSEEFVIRRAGLGREDAVFANGTVRLSVGDGQQVIRPLLQAMPPDGVAAAYQVAVGGPGEMELRLQRAGRRYVATIRSAIGEEDREFQAHTDTRVLEEDVAHHYYFLRDLRAGRSAHVLEPRTRRQVELVAGPRTEEEIRVGRNVVQARRVELAAGDDRRIVWYDRQGRVLRVEVPTTGYVAERSDPVG